MALGVAAIAGTGMPAAEVAAALDDILVADDSGDVVRGRWWWSDSGVCVVER